MKEILYRRLKPENPLRWEVNSESRGEEVVHTIDLEENQRSGQCSCEDFSFNIQPKLNQKLFKPHEDRSYCKHIREIRKILLNQVLDRWSEVFGHGKES